MKQVGPLRFGRNLGKRISEITGIFVACIQIFGRVLQREGLFTSLKMFRQKCLQNFVKIKIYCKNVQEKIKREKKRRKFLFVMRKKRTA